MSTCLYDLSSRKPTDEELLRVLNSSEKISPYDLVSVHKMFKAFDRFKNQVSFQKNR